MARTVLLNPGPVTLTDRVRTAFMRGDVCHREPEFAEVTQSITARLQQVYGDDSSTRHRAVLLTGSGTCAVEAMVSSFVPRTSRTLVVANGVYGERIAAMIRAHGGDLVLLRLPWEAPLDLSAVEQLLGRDGTITHVITVHHETTTGRLNDLDGLGALCARFDRKLLLDAVSSFGAEEIKFSEWNLTALAAAANKCLHAAPGVSFVLAEERLLREKQLHQGPLYFDLRNYYAHQSKHGYSPFTPCMHAAFALDEALDEHRELGGWEARRLRYRTVGARIRDALGSLGVDLLLPADAYGSMLHSYRLPPHVDYESLHDALKKEGFVIYAGQGRLTADIFRIAYMGDIRDDDVDSLEHRLRAFFLSHREDLCAKLSF